MSQSQTGGMHLGRLAVKTAAVVIVALIIGVIFLQAYNILVPPNTGVGPGSCGPGTAWSYSSLQCTAVQSGSNTTAQGGQFIKRGKIDVTLSNVLSGGAYSGATVILLSSDKDQSVDTLTESGSTGVYVSASATYVSGQVYHFKITKGSTTVKTMRIYSLTVDYGYSAQDTSDHAWTQPVIVVPTSVPTMSANEAGTAETSGATLNVTTTGRPTPLVSISIVNTVDNTGYVGVYTDLSTGHTLSMVLVCEVTAGYTIKSTNDWTLLKEIASGTDRVYWQGGALADDALTRWVNGAHVPYARPAGGQYTGAYGTTMTIDTSGMATNTANVYTYTLYYWLDTGYYSTIGSANSEAQAPVNLVLNVDK